MHKQIFLTFAVCWAVNVTASSSATSGCSSSECAANVHIRTTSPPPACDEVSDAVDAAVAPLQLKIQQQAQVMQGLILLVSNQTLPTAQCATLANNRLQIREVIAAIKTLEQRMEQQAQAIEGLINSVSNQNATESVSKAVAAAVAPLERRLECMFKSEQSTTTEELMVSKVAQLQTTIQAQDETIQELKLRMPYCGYESGYQYYPKTNSCYKMHEVNVTWTQANTTCHGTGAHLAVVNGGQEAQILRDISEARAGEWPVHWLWVHIGVFRSTDQVWRTVTGETTVEAGYNIWLHGNPYPDAKLSYAYLGSGKLHNFAGDWVNYFICEKKPE